MDTIVIIDHPLFAESLAIFLQKHMEKHVRIMLLSPGESIPLEALVLIELFLPEYKCGLQFAQQLQLSRPDVVTIVWTAQPVPLYIWVAMEYKISGFLDKTLPLPSLMYWLNHALINRAAWPGDQLIQAREWNQEMTVRLGALTEELWLLWERLVREENITDLAREWGWSKRTIERRLSALYESLGVRCRSEAINLAWRCGLVKMNDLTLNWFKGVQDMFLGSSLLRSRELKTVVPSESTQWGSIPNIMYALSSK
jgi:DNA-binding NarL/FixJ family response regulator